MYYMNFIDFAHMPAIFLALDNNRMSKIQKVQGKLCYGDDKL